MLGFIAYFLVLIQFGCIFFILLLGNALVDGFLLFFQIAGFAIGVWSVVVMKVKNFTILPQYKHGSELIISGPYKLVRHPMYLSVLLTLLPILIESCAINLLILYSVLFFVLIIKIKIEERILLEKFPAYYIYRKSSFYLIPLIW